MVTTFSKLERFVFDRICATYLFWFVLILELKTTPQYIIIVQDWADGDVGLLDTEKEKNEIYTTPDKEYGATQIQVTKYSTKVTFSFLLKKDMKKV